jgi:hypothetical protein
MYLLPVTMGDGKGIIDPIRDFDGRDDMEADAPKTLSVPEAGKRYFDLGKNASYDAARRGEIPVIKIGSRLRVPIVALERMLARAGNKADLA